MRRRLFLHFLALILAGLACNTFFPPRPEVSWDTSPKTIIVQVDTCCGMLYDPNGLPAATLWGDGRLIWVSDNSGSGRQVYTTTLTADEITTRLQNFVDAGFFGWKDYYEPPYQIYDVPSSCIHVNLSSQSKSVCTLMWESAPGKFGDLYAIAAGLTGTDYEPTQGYLQAISIGSPSPTGDVLQWPADSLGLSLKEAAGGVWIDGEVLELAWRIVNAQPYYALAREGPDYYNLILLIPGITRQQPPTPQ